MAKKAPKDKNSHLDIGFIFHGVIYKITNLINGHIYIGQTIKEMLERWRNHHYPGNKCAALRGGLNKYGIENFKIELIDWANSQEELNYKEWIWIHKENSLSPNGYNLREGGKAGPMTQTAIDKLKKVKSTPEYKANISKKQKEIWLDPEHIKKMEKLVGNRVICLETGEIFLSVQNAGRVLSIAATGIYSHLDNNISHTRGYTFRYLTDEETLQFDKGETIDFLKYFTPKVVIRTPKGAQKDYHTLQPRPIFCINTDRFYLNCSSAGKTLDISHKRISDQLRGERKHVKGYLFRLATPEEIESWNHLFT